MKKFSQSLLILFMISGSGSIAQISISNRATSAHVLIDFKNETINQHEDPGLQNGTNAATFLCDSIISWIWNDSTLDWNYRAKLIYTYDINGNTVSTTQQLRDGMNWKNVSKTEYTYNGNDITSQTVYNWDVSYWKNSSLNLYTYDTTGNVSHRLTQTWDGSAWENSYQYFYGYDPNFNTNYTLSQYWVAASGVWQNVYQYKYTYNQADLLVTDSMQQWSGAAWIDYRVYLFNYDQFYNKTTRRSLNWNGTFMENTYRDSFIYDANHKLIEHIGETWDGNVWVNNNRFAYAYDTLNHTIDLLQQIWALNAWTDVFKYHEVTDASGKRLDYISQVWDTTITAWRDFNRNIITYDVNDVPYSNVLQQWNSVTASLENTDSTHNYCYPSSVSLDDHSVPVGFEIYPNPAYAQFTIQSLQPVIEVKVYTMLGQHVDGKTSMEDPSVVNVEHLPPGIYFVEIITHERTAIQKLIVHRER